MKFDLALMGLVFWGVLGVILFFGSNGIARFLVGIDFRVKDKEEKELLIQKGALAYKRTGALLFVFFPFFY